MSQNGIFSKDSACSELICLSREVDQVSAPTISNFLMKAILWELHYRNTRDYTDQLYQIHSTQNQGQTIFLFSSIAFG